jgi:hypothetical protein
VGDFGDFLRQRLSDWKKGLRWATRGGLRRVKSEG